jgi:hypothetical protein
MYWTFRQRHHAHVNAHGEEYVIHSADFSLLIGLIAEPHNLTMKELEQWERLLYKDGFHTEIDIMEEIVVGRYPVYCWQPNLWLSRRDITLPTLQV